MSEHKILSFYGWLLLSLLGHLLFGALVLLQHPKATVLPQKPVPITVFAVSKPASPVPATISEPHTVKAETVEQKKPPPAAQPVQPKPTAAVAVHRGKPVKQHQAASTQTVTQDATTAPAPAEQVSVQTSAPADISALLNSVATRTAQRELSAAELAALTAPKAESAARSNSAIRRPANNPGTGPAADVLETLPDGSQLVRVGKGCVLATPGADLRKDIHSIKVVGCGAGGRTEQDRIDAHFEQVMSQLGQHR